MEVRVLYTMEMYIEGKDLNECREKWEQSNLADGEFVELNAVEDADTYNEISVWDFEHSKPSPYDFIKEGAKVYWNDPAINDYPQEEREDALKRVWVVDEINFSDELDPIEQLCGHIVEDTIISISTDGSTAEVYARELLPAKN